MAQFPNIKRVLVTGCHGFIGKTLMLALSERQDMDPIGFGRGDDPSTLPALVQSCDAVVHLAGENRPDTEAAFETVNVGLTQALCNALSQVTERNIPVIFASSTHADRDTAYGISKRRAEDVLAALSDQSGHPIIVYRLPGVFGKWSRPNYNSVVATFCHNIANGLDIDVRDPAAELSLVYVDDVVATFLQDLATTETGVRQGQVIPVYNTTLGQLADHIRNFRNCRKTLTLGRVGTGFLRALYSTYVSYIPIAQSGYDVVQHGDKRGVFVEMLKTSDSGQFSYFTAGPGVTRGGHYHHTKTEKFLVLKGTARFRFRHIVSNETFELITQGGTPHVVDTLPGWAHDITNIGKDEMIVMLWANEIFNPNAPDTFASDLET